MIFLVCLVPIDQAAALMESKTITVAKLLSISPQGTMDPTPHL